MSCIFIVQCYNYNIVHNSMYCMDTWLQCNSIAAPQDYSLRHKLPEISLCRNVPRHFFHIRAVLKDGEKLAMFACQAHKTGKTGVVGRVGLEVVYYLLYGNPGN